MRRRAYSVHSASPRETLTCFISVDESYRPQMQSEDENSDDDNDGGADPSEESEIEPQFDQRTG